MGRPTLRIVTRPQGNNRALVQGEVAPPAVHLEYCQVDVLVHAFRRMVRELAYDVCEMAFTTYLCARAHGVPFTALPVFLVRGFHHGAVVHHPAAGLTGPADLAGREVGVNRGYTVTTGVWARGILEEEYGLDLDQVTWRPSGDEHVAAYRPPRNVVPLPAGGSLEGRLATGELPAAVGIEADPPHTAPLVPDPEEAGYAALRQRGLYPINHLVVVRDAVLEVHRGLAAELFAAFATAKQRYVDRLGADAIAAPTPTDRMYRRVMDITGADPLPYGIAPNQTMVERLVAHAVRQHILDRPPEVADLFAAETRDLTG